MTGAFSQPSIRKAIRNRKISVSSSIVFFMLAALGVLVLSVWFKGMSSRIMSDQAVTPANSTDSSLTFRRILTADGKTENGFKYASFVYKASDCVSITDEVIFFDSAARANNELQKKLERASEILQHNAENDDKGKIVGERYVANFVGSDQAKPHSAIVLTRNSDLILITSASLTHALELEKALKGPNNHSAFTELESLSHVTFKSSGKTNGVNNDGIRFVREEFTSSDCEQLLTSAWYFDSPEKAQQELNKRLEEAVEVSERAATLDQAGKRVGNRAVAYFKAEAASGHLETAKIFWTDGSVLHSIEGAYTYALQFEIQQKQLAGVAQR